MEPILFDSKSNSDHRGTVSFTNNLNLRKVVRTYKVKNKQVRTVRAWHGHKIEEKWISVEDGEFWFVLYILRILTTLTRIKKSISST